MNFSFTPLETSHFPLLLKWLETPHVKEWWDQDIRWTPQLIKEKYGAYVHHQKSVYAYIMNVNQKPVGYIQYYNFYDFPREGNSDDLDLPQSLAAFDVFIGEKEWFSKGVGSRLIEHFVKNYIFPDFQACFVDPDTNNKGAIRAYEKAGFRKLKENHITIMIKTI